MPATSSKIGALMMNAFFKKKYSLCELLQHSEVLYIIKYQEDDKFLKAMIK